MRSLYLYADESGTHDPAGKLAGAETACIFGYVADAQHWTQFTSEWRAVLGSERVSEFHMQEFVDLKHGPSKPDWPYRDWDQGRRDAFLERLIRVSVDNTFFAIGGSVDLVAYNEIFNPEVRTAIRHPYHFCFQLIIDSLHKTLESYVQPSLSVGDSVEFFFHKHKEWSKTAKDNFSDIKQVRNSFDWIGKLSFVNAEDHPPIQAADMLAYLMRQSTTKLTKDGTSYKRSSWEISITRDQPVRREHYDREALLLLERRLCEQNPEIPELQSRIRLHPEG